MYEINIELGWWEAGLAVMLTAQDSVIFPFLLELLNLFPAFFFAQPNLI